MYAVIKTGGKQYRVAAGEKLKVEQIPADVGAEVVLDQVLAVGTGSGLTVGTPLVAGASVKATVVSHGKHDKVRIFKMRRRKHYQKRQGHRQLFTELLIGEIVGSDGKSAKAAPAPKAAEPKTEAPKKAAAPKAAAKKSKDGKDKLTVVEGIGPKAQETLYANGISTYAQLADANVDDIQKMLDDADTNFSVVKPGTWPEQAALLRDGKMEEFKKLTDELDGGVRKS